MSKMHLVLGGRVTDPQTLEFQDLSKVDLVGVFPDYASAEKAWRGAAQRTGDDAEICIACWNPNCPRRTETDHSRSSHETGERLFSSN